MSEVNGTINWGFSNREGAEYHLSAFNTIVEVMGKLMENTDGIINLFPEYFQECLDDAVDNGMFETKQEAFDLASKALGSLLAINQRLAFMMATEVAEAIGGPLPNESDMVDPIVRTPKLEEMTKEEVMDELKRIMSRNNDGGIQ